jgi:SsrA-binding protein
MAKNTSTSSPMIHSGLIAQNKRARFDYQILEEIEAGLILTGTEVKSMRLGKAQINDAHAAEKNGEIWLLNAKIAPYAMGNRFNHEETRPRKCLLKKRQADKLLGAIKTKGMTLIPIRLYFNNRGIAKVLLGLGKGKKEYEKRDSIKQRDWDRQKAQIVRTYS